MTQTQAQYHIGGMACSFCAESIRKACERTAGVESVEVSLAHEEVSITYDDDVLDGLDLKDTLRNLGYTIRDPDKEKRFEEQQEELADAKRKLQLAGGTAVVTAVLMLWMIFGRGTFESQSRVMDFVALGLALGTMFGPGRYIKEKAYYSLRRGILNQHVLLEAGAFAGLLGGLLGSTVVQEFPAVHYFSVSVFITTYHILSEYSSLLVRTRASGAVKSLLDLQPDTARRVREDGTPEEVPVEELDVGDSVRIKPGERIPVDGTVIGGESTVDESVATGESMPVQKIEGDPVIGGSINDTGTVLVEVTATGESAFLNQVAREIEQARAKKPGIVKLADRILKYFVPAVLVIAGLSVLFWTVGPFVWGGDPDARRGAFAALAVLVLGYPCALGMATPLALIRGGGEAANRGVLMRSGDSFQSIHTLDVLAFDKTGTITVGEPTVVEVVSFHHCGENDVLQTAAGAEAFSEHPLADAILDHADAHDVAYADPDSFESVTGKGVRATVDGTQLLVGKPGWISREGVSIEDAIDDIENLQERGLTVSSVVRDEKLVGLVGFGDELKADTRETIARVREAGITPMMITGDTERTARAVASEVGIERVLADVLPDEKREQIGTLQRDGNRVGMVGDGINDAPALTQADVGMAIGAGTDIAIESADVVIVGDRLGGVMDAYEIGAESYRKTRQNLFAAFSFNGIGVALATTGLVHPIWAMIAMVLSVSVVLANSFAGQLLSEDGVTTHFDVADGEESGGAVQASTS